MTAVLDLEAAPRRRPPRTTRRRAPWWVFASVLAVAAAAYLINLRVALDFDLDEVMYTIAGQNVAAADSVSWGEMPTSVHPPVHFLLVGLWTLITGTADGSIVDALFAARYLGALCSVLVVGMVGLLARRHTRNGWLVAGAMLLAAGNGFLVRFGRTALIEPTALLAGLGVVLLALRLRRAASPVYIGIVGLVSGIALLIKEPLIFTVLVPVLAAVLERDFAYLRRAATAVLVAMGIWGMFPLWAVLNGAGAWWWSEHDTSLQRISGLLQVSGLNRPGVSSTGVFGDTFTTYVSGYLTFGIGALGLLVLAYRGGLFHRRKLRARTASLVAFGVLSYGFLAYCVLLGQANEQLTAYSAVPAVLLSVLAWGDRMPKVIVAAVTAVVLASLAAWTWNVAMARDDASTRMGGFLTENYACAPVNATGNALRWAPVLPRNHVEGFRDGGTAVEAGVRLFLLSPKDSRMRYGNSSPELDTFVRTYGSLVQQYPSRRYEQIELWSVPGPQLAARDCGNTRPPIAQNASALRFLALLIAAAAGLGTVTYGWNAVHRRREWARDWAKR
ncbi:ArnT family glycosyltransferase [Actinoplanes sp. NPDC051859]|uniref:ArnT family glycosyltransferase n=1 Tax=Actinoplanes sp. NPDC051859 TaxID=3363909 RepID=UPI00379F3AC0